VIADHKGFILFIRVWIVLALMNVKEPV